VFCTQIRLSQDFSRIFFRKLKGKEECNHRQLHPLYILTGLQDRSNRTTLADHIQRMQPKQYRITGNKLKPWKKLLGLAFHAVADLLINYETSRDSCHTAAINGHSHFRGTC
jgi:hypothetical protein